ncbi:hypothetical protein [Siphonobacter aquaeclarae]|jgi:hypothetical protein|uniref:Uncharacterized protein n=1 Tax=Siphonobacter aquaeclarae TaxID=563176 RepID=A0A1G9IMF5_9BACT|nr:hypothetical protein [Siphonobacter aquaeclarae]SDL26479.1 hypothetical protein SAMN04488090_0545 [Siphonobacter aquaeclarae]
MKRFFCLLGLCWSLSASGQSLLPVDKNLVVEEDKLSEQQLRDFQELTHQKVAEFQKYLSVIADPKQAGPVRELAIENALLLFLPDARMEVGTIKTNMLVREYPLSVYLRRLKNLDKKYFDVSITFYDLALVGDWQKTQAGYETTATYFQHFQGNGGTIRYEDKTVKKMNVDLRNRKDPFYEENRWTVLLGNVRVAEIQPATPK